jgi:hypothetical protein
MRQMHELRLDKHLKTKEVEMLALPTINIISVDEKLENSQNLGGLRRAGREGGGFGCISIAVWCSKQQRLLVCKKSDYNSDSFKTHGCTRGAALRAGWLNCLSSEPKYSPTPALESGKTRVHEVGQEGGGSAAMGPGVNTCDFPAKCRFAKVQGSAGHRYAGHIMPPLTCQPAKHRAYQAEQNTNSFRFIHSPLQKALVSVQFWGCYKKEERRETICGGKLFTQFWW